MVCILKTSVEKHYPINIKRESHPHIHISDLAGKEKHWSIIWINLKHIIYLPKPTSSFHWTTSVSVSENDTFPVYINGLELLSEANNLIPRKVYITLSSSCNMRQLDLVIELSNMFHILLCQHTVIELSLKRNKTYITWWPAALTQYRWHFENLSFMPWYQHVNCSHRLICYAVKVEQWSSNIEDFLVPRTTCSLVAEQVIIRF